MCYLKKIIIPILGVLLNIPLIAAQSASNDVSDATYSIYDSKILVGNRSPENLAKKEIYRKLIGKLPNNQILSVRGEKGEITKAMIELLPESINNNTMHTMVESQNGYRPSNLDDDSIKFVFEYMQFGFAEISLKNLDQAVEILHYAHQVMVPDLIIDLMTTLKDLPKIPISDEGVAAIALHFVNHFDTYTIEAQKLITNYLSQTENSGGIDLLLREYNFDWHSLFKNTNLFGRKEIECWGAYCTSHVDKINEDSFLKILDVLRFYLMTKNSYEKAIAPYSRLRNQSKGAALWRLLCLSSEQCRAKVDGVRSYSPKSILEIQDVDSFVFIPDGIFQFGSDALEAGRHNLDSNQRHETVKGFYIAQHHVSNELFHRVMGTSVADDTKSKHPVVNIDLHNVERFIRLLNQTMERSLVDNKHRLRFRMLSEVEWEYSARLATNHLNKIWATNETELRLKAKNFWYEDNSQKSTQPIDARPLGFNTEFFNPEYPLYSILGNVYTWTNTVVANSRNVLRGGSWYSFMGNIRLGHRIIVDRPEYLRCLVGLRLAMDLVDLE